MGKAEQLRVGLIGLGRMGQNHLRVLSGMEPIQVAFIYDVDGDKTSRLARQYGVKGSDDPEKDLSCVDAAIIATPTTTHAWYIDLAARFTPHLFVEKPLTDCLETTRAVADIARAKNLRIQVGFIERFNPVVRKLKQVSTCGAPVINMDFVRTDKVTDRNLDVDVVLDLMIHDLDLALLLCGPVVQALGYGYAQNGTTVLAHAVLVHENGALSRILASKMTEKRVRTVGITCPDLFAEADLLQQNFVLHPEGGLRQKFDVPTGSGEAVPCRPGGPLYDQLLAFVAYCRGRSCEETSLVPTLEAAMAAMELAECIRGSIARNQTAASLRIPSLEH
jgi:predicted dehydrogenase